VINLSPVSTIKGQNLFVFYKFITCVKDTGDQFMTGVKATGDRFKTGVVDTSDKLLTQISPRMFMKIQNGCNPTIRALEEAELRKKTNWRKSRVRVT